MTHRNGDYPNVFKSLDQMLYKENDKVLWKGVICPLSTGLNPSSSPITLTKGILG